jgi:5,10-methylenetetrahydromethanopterin reductase
MVHTERSERTTRMRIGVSFPKDVSMSRYREVARLTEEAGLASLWANDAFGRDPLLVCQAWAEATSELQIGVGVMQILTRSPTQVAKAAATLQELSAGRFLLGLGVSQPSAMRWHGLEMRPPLAAARDALAIIRSVSRGELTDYEGAVLASVGFRLGITPLPEPAPLYLGAMGPRMLELAGTSADGVLLSWESAAAVARQAARVRAAAERARRTAPEIAAYVRVAVAADRGAARRALAEEVAFYWPFYAEHFAAQLPDASIAAAAAAFERGAPDAVPDEVLLALGWYGTPDDGDGLRSTLSTYEQAGLEHFVARVVPVGDPVDSLRRVLRTLP